jgi:glycosyltransferase involved in cell wall biosynthesis
MKRILLYGHFAKYGGTETHVSALAQLLSRAGAEVVIASLSRDLFDAQQTVFHEAGIETVSTGLCYDSPLRLKHVRALGLWLGKLPLHSFDIVCGFGAGGFLSLLSTLRKRDGLLYFNECSAGIRSRYFDKSAITLRVADGILCNALTVEENMRRSYTIGAPVRVLPHFTCLDMNRPATKRFAPKGVLRVAFFGRLDPSKGPALLLDVWSDLDIGPAELTFYGDGELRGQLQEVVARRRLSNVKFGGGYDQRNDLGRLLSGVDLVVLPSPSEGLGLVLLEAMFYGVPFVGTNNGGPRDIASAANGCLAVEPSQQGVKSGIERLKQGIMSGRISAQAIQDDYMRRFSVDVLWPRWRAAFLEPVEFWKQPSC